MHILCTICSDLVNQAENIYVTKCGHIFHYQCLFQWIERSKSCPQCRCKVTGKCMFRVYPTISNETFGEDVTTLQARLDDAQLQLRTLKTSCKATEDKLTIVTEDLKKSDAILKESEKKLVSRESAIAALKEQLNYVKIQNKMTQKLKEENETIKKTMQTMQGLQKVLNATSEEVEEMMKGYTDLQTVATFATAFKRALCESELKKKELRGALQAARRQLADTRARVGALQQGCRQLEEKIETMERSGPPKRKADSLSSSASDGEPEHKRPSVDERTNAYTELSVTSMVHRIESADSPYLTLKQGGLAHGALHASNQPIKPSEYGILKSVRPENKSTSIFSTKRPMEFKEERIVPSELDMTYDGLGGHSRPDVFPVPNPRPVLNNFMPKVSAKHKLKRPAGIQDISKMMTRRDN